MHFTLHICLSSAYFSKYSISNIFRRIFYTEQRKDTNNEQHQTALVLIKFKDAKRAVTYPLLLLPLIAVALIFAFVQRLTLAYWGVAAILCVLLFAFVLVTKKQDAVEEIKAKFSVQ